MSTYDLYYALVEYYGTEQEALEELKSLSNGIRAAPGNIISDIDEFIEDKCNDYSLCPDCFSSLDKTMILSDNLEYFGCPVNEEMSKYQCPECGWNSED